MFNPGTVENKFFITWSFCGFRHVVAHEMHNRLVVGTRPEKAVVFLKSFGFVMGFSCDRGLEQLWMEYMF